MTLERLNVSRFVTLQTRRGQLSKDNTAQDVEGREGVRFERDEVKPA